MRDPLWHPPLPAALKAGSEAVAKAMVAPTKTEREKDYIAAIEAFYRDNDKLDHRTRVLASKKAIAQVYLKYPEDREAAVFYGPPRPRCRPTRPMPIIRRRRTS